MAEYAVGIGLYKTEEEALKLAYEEWTCCDLCMFSFDCKTNRTDCKKAQISKIKQQAEARLKEKKE